MRYARESTLLLLVVAAVMLLLFPFLLFAQDTALVIDTLLAAPVSPPSLTDAINLLLTVGLAAATPYVMRALERLSTWLGNQPAFVKQAIVTMIPAVVTYGVSLLSQVWPWFPWDPSWINAALAAFGAFSLHAGVTSKAANQKATAALQVAKDTREMQGG